MCYYYWGDRDLPNIIEVAEHHYVERKLINLWCADMSVAWFVMPSHQWKVYCLLTRLCRKLATNCARSYNLALAGNGSVPNDWPFKPALKGDHVYHGFIIVSLLDDHRERNEILSVPHDGEQEHRFKQAVREWNARIKLYGQPEILHACKKCVRLLVI